MSDDLIMLAADDQEVYNTNHIIWNDVWLVHTPKSITELIREANQLCDNVQYNDEQYINKCIVIAIMIIKKFAFSGISSCPKYEREIASLILPFLKYVKQFISGSLYTFISQIQFKWGLIEPQQAPKGWKCSLCLESKYSHMTVKTECGHFFHVKCHAHLTNPSCPLCRQIMNV
jgi:hypothetical protein